MEQDLPTFNESHTHMLLLCLRYSKTQPWISLTHDNSNLDYIGLVIHHVASPSQSQHRKTFKIYKNTLHQKLDLVTRSSGSCIHLDHTCDTFTDTLVRNQTFIAFGPAPTFCTNLPSLYVVKYSSSEIPVNSIVLSLKVTLSSPF